MGAPSIGRRRGNCFVTEVTLLYLSLDGPLTLVRLPSESPPQSFLLHREPPVKRGVAAPSFPRFRHGPNLSFGSKAAEAVGFPDNPAEGAIARRNNVAMP